MFPSQGRLSALLAVLAAVSSAVVAAPAPFPTDKNVTEALHLLSRQSSTVYTSCTQPNTVALTFDDGPYIYENDIVNTLNANNAKGTFFLNGNNWECIYDDSAIASIRNAYNSGHHIASHTWSHLDLAQQTWDKIHDEMWKTQLALTRIIGQNPSWFRPPYGSYNDMVLQAAAIRNMNTVLWDFDSGDSTGATAQQSKDAYQSTVNQHPNTILALNHETYDSSAHDVLPYAIQTLQSAGYKLVTVAECLGSSNLYWGSTAPGTKDSTWVC